MIFIEIRELPQADIRRYHSILDGTRPWPVTPDRDEVILVLSVDFGYGWEMDVNICKGEPTPYVDVVLFHDGCEVYSWEICDELVGEWQVVLGADLNRAFRLEIRPEENA